MLWKLLKIEVLVITLLLNQYQVLAQTDKHQFSIDRLGTTVSATFYHSKNLNASAVEQQLIALLDSLDLIFSDYNINSEVRVLARNYERHQSMKVSEPLFDLLHKSQGLSIQTKGRFDVTIGALSKLWRTYLSNNMIPSKRLVRKTKRAVGYQHIVLDSIEQTVKFRKKHMSFDFGAVGKGYIADQLAHYLEALGITRYLIDLGGDMLAGDPPPNKLNWLIEISWASTNVTLANTAIATSGPDYQFFVHRGKRYSHLIDPATGWGISRPFNTTAITKKGWLSDAVASCAALLSPKETLQWIDGLVDVEVLLQREGTLYQSKGFCKYVVPN